MLEKIFCDKKYNFYEKMHSEIKKFLHENYPTSEDAFKFFHNVKTYKQETPTYNDTISGNVFISKSEFFNGINKMFPNKYRPEIMELYYQKLFCKRVLNKNETPNIKFSEFNADISSKNYVYLSYIPNGESSVGSVDSDSYNTYHILSCGDYHRVVDVKDNNNYECTCSQKSGITGDVFIEICPNSVKQSDYVIYLNNGNEMIFEKSNKYKKIVPNSGSSSQTTLTLSSSLSGTNTVSVTEIDISDVTNRLSNIYQNFSLKV